MFGITKNRSRSKPPLGSRIIAGHPLAPDVACLLMNEGAGLRVNNLCKPSIFQTTAGTIRSPGGVTFPTITDYVSLGTDSSLRFPTTQVSIFFEHFKTDATMRASAVFSINTGTDADMCNADVPYSDGTVYWDFGRTSGSGGGRISVPSLSFAQRNVWCFTSGPRAQEIWQGHKLCASGSNALTRTNVGMSCGINGGGLVNGDLVDIGFFYIYSRNLPKEAILAIITNPYSFIEQPSSVRFFIPAAGTSFQPVWARGSNQVIGSHVS